MKTEKLLRIYLKSRKVVYKPIRKHHNIHSFG